MSQAGTIHETEAQPSPQTFGIKLLDAPVARWADPRARMYIIDHLNPGQSIQRRVLISNDSGAPQHVTVYATGADIKDDRFVFTPSAGGDELATWVGFDHAGVDLAPHAQTAVQSTIAVPDRAVEGERYAVIWAQITSPPTPGTNVSLVNRTGVRIYLDVGPGGDPPSDFDIEQLTPERSGDNHLQLLARVRNTGRRALDMSGTLTLTEGPDSLSAGPFTAELGTTLAPGDVGVVRVPLTSRLPLGPWKANLTLASGTVSHSVTASVSFPTDHATNGLSRSSVTISALAACAVLFLILSLLLRRTRRRAGARYSAR